jgi:hypothetical protein
VSCCLQLELSSRLERERLEASLVEATAAKQRLSDQLAAAQQVIGKQCSRHASTPCLRPPCGFCGAHVCLLAATRARKAGTAGYCSTEHQDKCCVVKLTSMGVFCTVCTAQELSRLSMECGQLRAAADETRAAAEEARRGRAALQVLVQCTQMPIGVEESAVLASSPGLAVAARQAC